MSTPIFPPAFLPDGEAQKFLLKFKTTLQKRLSLNRSGDLFEEVDLACFLTALERREEALEITRFLSSNVSFSGNYSIWTPIGYALGLQIRLLRESGDSLGAADALARLQANPAMSWSSDDLAKRIAGAQAAHDDALQERSQKYACILLTRSVLFFIYYRETAVPGFPQADWHHVSALDAIIDDGLKKLSARLQK